MSIQDQGHFLTLGHGHLHIKIKTVFSQKPLGFSDKICMQAFRYKEMKIC